MVAKVTYSKHDNLWGNIVNLKNLLSIVFSIKGVEHSDDKCAFKPSPSHDNEVCNDFYKWRGKPLVPSDPGVVIRFRDRGSKRKKNRHTFCYSPEAGR